MPRRAKTPAAQLNLLEPRVHTAPCVPAIKEAVNEWRAANYKGVTETTRLLLNHWFHTDHRLPNGRPFLHRPSSSFVLRHSSFVVQTTLCFPSPCAIIFLHDSQ